MLAKILYLNYNYDYLSSQIGSSEVILNMKRCIEYSSQRVWVGHTMDLVKLLTAITSHFTDWKTSQNSAFQIFRKYEYGIAETYVHDGV